MKRKNQKKIMSIVWIITDVIILICAILLLAEGGTFNTILAIGGIILIIVEYFLYKNGYILK